jgi:hypothetical protein
MNRSGEVRVRMTIFANAVSDCPDFPALRKIMPHRTGDDSIICTGTVQIQSHTLALTDYRSDSVPALTKH